LSPNGNVSVRAWNSGEKGRQVVIRNRGEGNNPENGIGVQEVVAAKQKRKNSTTEALGAGRTIEKEKKETVNP